MNDVRLIDANALKSLLIEVLERIKENPKMTRDEMHIISGCHMLCEMIDDAPTIDAVEVVHGRWKRFEEISGNIGVSCSVCGWKDYHHGRYKNNLYNYCPNCGAKMDAKDMNVPTKDKEE